MIKLMGAKFTGSDEEKIYEPIGPVYVNPQQVAFVYDHTVVMQGMKLRVMESAKEIVKKLTMI